MPDLKPELTLDPDTAFFVVLKAREFNVKEEDTDPDTGSNATDDMDIDVLEFLPDDAVEEEFTAAVEPLNEDQKLDLIALAWIGRGDFGFDEWAEARESAREVDPTRTAAYLLDMPALGDYLEDSLSELGYSLDDYLARDLPGASPRQTGAPSG